jgi:hypothetical protein
MGTRKRTARRFQVEALEGRLAPGDASGGVLVYGITRSSGEEIPQAQVVPVVHGSKPGGTGDGLHDQAASPFQKVREA